MVWLSYDEPQPQFLREGFRSRKHLFTIFFLFSRTSLSGWNASTVYHHSPILYGPGPSSSPGTLNHVCINPLPILPFVAPWQCCTPQNSPNYAVLRATRDNSSPTYSLDLVPCDLWLCPKFKAAVAGKQFHCIQELTRTVKLEPKRIPASEYHDCFKKWRRRVERWIEVEGEYFEGM